MLGLSVPACKTRRTMAPPHSCCEDELNVSKAQVQSQAPRTPHGWGLLALTERTQAMGLLPSPHLLETETACPCVCPATGPAPWPLLSGTCSTITAPQLPQDLSGTWGVKCQLNVGQAFLCLFRLSNWTLLKQDPDSELGRHFGLHASGFPSHHSAGRVVNGFVQKQPHAGVPCRDEN